MVIRLMFLRVNKYDPVLKDIPTIIISQSGDLAEIKKLSIWVFRIIWLKLNLILMNSSQR